MTYLCEFALFKAAIAKEQYGSNAATEEKVINFFRFIQTFDPKAAEVLSANLRGPSKRYMRSLNSRDRDPCVLDSGENDSLVIKRMVEAINRRPKCSFSLAIDATKVARLVELARGYGAILGGEYPQHIISIEGMKEEKVKMIMDSTKESTEIKICVMTFQDAPAGVTRSEIVAARPQSNNESNEFVKAMEAAASSALVSLRIPISLFLNFSVDGVSCESRHVWLALCLYLSCKSNHTGATDTNHNCKSWRYQIIAGGGVVGCTMGKYVIDAGLLRMGGVAMDLLRPPDFSSDHLVLKLYSDDCLRKIFLADSKFGSTCNGDKVVLAMTFFFLRLHLHTVNAQVPATYRVQYLWCSMLWLTSINGASIITKQNIVSETISFIFLVFRADVTKPRLITSEPAEHMFGQLRQMIREFTVAEFAQLVEKLLRRLKQMYKHEFRPSRDPQKGYSATWKSFFEHSLLANEDTMMKGAVNLKNDGDFVANQMWGTVTKIIYFSSKSMLKLFALLDVPMDERSPFCRTFTSLTDLRDQFIHYLPNTFTYNDVLGNAADEQTKEEEEDDGDSGDGDDSTQLVVDQIHRFAEDMRGDNVVVVEDEDGGSAPNLTASVNDNNEVANNTEELMSNFRSIFGAASIDELQTYVSLSSSCLASTEHVSGSTSQELRTKSLVQRWIANPFSIGKDKKDHVVAEDILIQRDVIILVNVMIGNQSNASTVASPFRVLMIYEKYYNKWFASKPLTKRWGKEKKPYKVMIRMIEKNELDEYSDMGLYDPNYKKDDVCKIIGDGMILHVVGMLHVVG